MRYEYVLFDLDGTLMDTSEGILKAIDYTVEKCGYPVLSEEKKKTFIGPPIYNSLKLEYSLTDEEAHKAMDIFRDIYKDEYLCDAIIYEEIEELLLSLQNNNIKIGVATYKREDYAIKLIEAFDLMKYFDIVVGADADNILTKADIIQICIDKMGCVDLSKAVMVGDTLSDMDSAKSVRIDSIAVTYGFGLDKNNIKDYNFKQVADSVKGILECL